MPVQFTAGRFSATTDAGLPLVGGRLYTYLSGTSTFQTTYTTATLGAQNTYTDDGTGQLYLTLDARGEASVWLTPATAYSMVLKTPLGATIWTDDGVIDQGDQLRADLANTANGKGTTLVGSNDAGGYYTGTTAESQLQAIGAESDHISLWNYCSASDITAAKAYSYATNFDSQFTAAMADALAQKKDLFIPDGGYLVTGLTIPGTHANAFKHFRMYGSGVGNPFSTSSYGAIIKSVTDAPVLQYQSDASSGNPSDEQMEIYGLRLWGNSASFPVAYFEGFYGLCEFHHNVIIQSGNGGGLEIAYCATGHIHHNYIYNKDVVTSGLGASRVGTGIWVYNLTGDGGLQRITHNTCRGWLLCYKLGDTHFTLYNPVMEHNECSQHFNGIELTSKCKVAKVSHTYFEACDFGVEILDNGIHTTIVNNWIPTGYSIGISSGTTTWGCVIDGNHLEQTNLDNVTGIKVDCTGAFAGLNRTITNNTIAWGSGTGTRTNAVGIQVLGNSPPLTIHGNMFNPASTWVGGAGTKAFDDQTTGTGIKGFGRASNPTGGQHWPMVIQGAYSVGLESNVLTATDITAGALTISEASDFVLTLAGAGNITSIAPTTRSSGKLFWIRATNANPTFVNGGTLKMAGGVNFTPGANGAMICFKIQAGVCWEVCRTAY